MRYLHTMLRVRDLDAALDFYCNKLGLMETRRRVDEKGRYTLVFLAAPRDESLVEGSKASRAARHRSSSSPTTGTAKTTARRAISAISPSRSTTSTPPAIA